MRADTRAPAAWVRALSSSWSLRRSQMYTSTGPSRRLAPRSMREHEPLRAHRLRHERQVARAALLQLLGHHAQLQQAIGILGLLDPARFEERAARQQLARREWRQARDSARWRPESRRAWLRRACPRRGFGSPRGAGRGPCRSPSTSRRSRGSTKVSVCGLRAASWVCLRTFSVTSS